MKTFDQVRWRRRFKTLRGLAKRMLSIGLASSLSVSVGATKVQFGSLEEVSPDSQGRGVVAWTSILPSGANTVVLCDTAKCFIYEGYQGKDQRGLILYEHIFKLNLSTSGAVVDLSHTDGAPVTPQQIAQVQKIFDEYPDQLRGLGVGRGEWPSAPGESMDPGDQGMAATPSPIENPSGGVWGEGRGKDSGAEATSPLRSFGFRMGLSRSTMDALGQAHDAGVRAGIQAGLNEALKAATEIPESTRREFARYDAQIQAEQETYQRLIAAEKNAHENFKQRQAETVKSFREKNKAFGPSDLKYYRPRVNLEGVAPDIADILNKVQNDLTRIPAIPKNEPLTKGVVSSVELSAESSRQNDSESAKFYADVAVALVDVGLSLTPGVSEGKDIYELIVGRNLVTGEPLAHWERAMALLGVVSLGASSLGIKSGTLVAKVIENSPKIEKIVLATRRLVIKLGTFTQETFSKLQVKTSKFIGLAEKRGAESLESMKTLARDEAQNLDGLTAAESESLLGEVGAVEAVDGELSGGVGKLDKGSPPTTGGGAGGVTGKPVRGIPALKFLGPEGWISKEGLYYNSKRAVKYGDQNALRHVLRHVAEDPTKVTHTVFNCDIKEIPTLIDEAWKNRHLGKRIAEEGRNSVYIVKMPKIIGTTGETELKIVIEKGTMNHLISAYPWRSK